MSSRKPHIVEIGHGGRIHLPKEIMKSIGAVPGNQLRFEVEGDSVRILRHQVKDPFAEAARKKTPDIRELMNQQAARKKEAADLFEKGMQEKHVIRPEDREDFWR